MTTKVEIGCAGFAVIGHCPVARCENRAQSLTRESDDAAAPPPGVNADPARLFALPPRSGPPSGGRGATLDLDRHFARRHPPSLLLSPPLRGGESKQS